MRRLHRSLFHAKVLKCHRAMRQAKQRVSLGTWQLGSFRLLNENPLTSCAYLSKSLTIITLP